MNDFLQIIGSLASIIGIPLAVFLYLKGKAQIYVEVRRDIVKRLSYQIGEGRKNSQFELNAVIDSMKREKRLKKTSISPDSIVEDLISETISSPLLDKSRKDSLVVELELLHSECFIYDAIKNDNLHKIEDVKDQGLSVSFDSSKGDVFGVTATILIGAVASYAYSVGEGLLEKLATISFDKASALGVSITLVAIFVSLVADWKIRRK